MTEKRTWTITLDEYQRNNLLKMLNSFGAPHGNPWHNKELSQLVSVDSGDWFCEVANLLGGVLQPGESVYGCRPPEPGFMVKNLQDKIEQLEAEVNAYRQAYIDVDEYLAAFKDWDFTEENLPEGWVWNKWDKGNDQ